jgi:hypothetical protein
MKVKNIILIEEKLRRQNEMDTPSDYIRKGSSIFACFKDKNPKRIRFLIARNWRRLG